MRRRRGPHSRQSLGNGSSVSDFVSNAIGGQLNTLTNKEKHEINDGVLHILSEIGFEHLPKFLECFVDNKTITEKITDTVLG